MLQALLVCVLLVAPDAGEALTSKEAILARLERFDRAWPEPLKTMSPEQLAQLLHGMVELDQAARKLEPIDLDVLRKVDAHNLEIMRPLLARFDWFTISKYGAKADDDAWLLVQHADKAPDFQKQVLARLEKHVEAHESRRNNYAYLFDRVAIADGRPQRYGTQGRCTGPGRWQPKPIEDAAKVDERRAWAEIWPPKHADYVEHISRACK
jgi:hypothetical protein